MSLRCRLSSSSLQSWRPRDWHCATITAVFSKHAFTAERARPFQTSCHGVALPLLPISALPTRTYSSFHTRRLPHGALRILFCGSDSFSAASLRTLHDEQQRNPGLIESIDVLYRPAKRTGRGLKELTFPPIHDVCHCLPRIRQTHHIDTFKSWDTYPDRPTDINLIVAVSFGLLIPAKLIEDAAYGGLNVHPSLLPDLAGAAPIHHTLLKRRTHTGVTVQTLHPTKFDTGIKLAQTPPPGIPVPDDATTKSLTDALAAEGAKLLLQTLRASSFVQPAAHQISDFTADQLQRLTNGAGIAKAPKIRKEDARIDWRVTSADEILLKLRVFGSVWAELVDDPRAHPSRLACDIGDPASLAAAPRTATDKDERAGRRTADSANARKLRVVYDDIVEVGAGKAVASASWRDYAEQEGFPVRTADGRVLLVRQCTIAGGRKSEGVRLLRSMAERAESVEAARETAC